MELVLAFIGSGAFSALISGLFTLAANRRRKDDGVVAGVRMMLYVHLKREGRMYVEAGQVSSEDLEDFMKMHEVYHTALGGNGFLDSVVSQVRKLRIVD